MSTHKKKIVIVGGGTAGWMAANLMAARYKDAHISLIESKDIGIIGVGEGSTPTLRRFFHTIGVEEKEWMPVCNATYKCNIRFDGWSDRFGVNSYSHPFTSQPDVFVERAFFTNCLTRRLGLDVETRPQKFFLNSVLAKEGKAPIASENFPFLIEYGYHFDSALLGGFLKKTAKLKGLQHIVSNVVEVNQNKNGNISSLLLDDGSKVEGDFYIDCTGFSSLLLQQKLGVKFKSFSSNLFNDTAVVLPTPIGKNIPVETVSTAVSNGWIWQIPLRSRVGNGYVYSSNHISDNDAEEELRRFCGALDDDVEARHLKMRVGQVERHWHKNCLALGLSQGFIEPLEATALHLVQTSVETFFDFYKEGNYGNDDVSAFNQQISQRFEYVRDYIVAHYKLNNRTDSEYWQDNANNENLSDSLLQLLDVWYRRGNISALLNDKQQGTQFNAASWHCLLSGYGIYPNLEKNQPIKGKGDLYLEANIESYIRRCSLNFESHQNNLLIK